MQGQLFSLYRQASSAAPAVYRKTKIWPSSSVTSPDTVSENTMAQRANPQSGFAEKLREAQSKPFLRVLGEACPKHIRRPLFFSNCFVYRSGTDPRNQKLNTHPRRSHQPLPCVSPVCWVLVRQISLVSACCIALYSGVLSKDADCCSSSSCLSDVLSACCCFLFHDRYNSYWRRRIPWLASVPASFGPGAPGQFFASECAPSILRVGPFMEYLL